MMRWFAVLILISIASVLLAPIAGCSSPPPLPTVESVDLERFMGDWYVVAHIPGWGEEEAYNGVETYQLEEDGSIATTYAFRDGGFDGDLEVLEPSAVVEDRETNATWGMQFIWPFRFEYLITYLDEDYSTTIIARTARDYAWIMTREPEFSEERFAELRAELEAQGYETKDLRRVPQRWPDPGHPANEHWRSRIDAR